LATSLRPDLVIVDYQLSDGLGLDVCRAIRELPTVDETIPLIITTEASLSRAERRECFRSGIWDIFFFPFDPVELVSKLEAFVSARRQAEQAWDFAHEDRVTGLYNGIGLLARAVELVADGQPSRRWPPLDSLRGSGVGPTEGSNAANRPIFRR
jgi:DNA-binding response OmpR family regulator